MLGLIKIKKGKGQKRRGVIYAAYLGLGEEKKVPMHLLNHYLSMVVINDIANEYWILDFFEQQVARMKAFNN